MPTDKCQQRQKEELSAYMISGRIKEVFLLIDQKLSMAYIMDQKGANKKKNILRD